MASSNGYQEWLANFQCKPGFVNNYWCAILTVSLTQKKVHQFNIPFFILEEELEKEKDNVYMDDHSQASVSEPLMHFLVHLLKQSTPETNQFNYESSLREYLIQENILPDGVIYPLTPSSSFHCLPTECKLWILCSLIGHGQAPLTLPDCLHKDNKKNVFYLLPSSRLYVKIERAVEKNPDVEDDLLNRNAWGSLYRHAVREQFTLLSESSQEWDVVWKALQRHNVPNVLYAIRVRVQLEIDKCKNQRNQREEERSEFNQFLASLPHKPVVRKGSITTDTSLIVDANDASPNLSEYDSVSEGNVPLDYTLDEINEKDKTIECPPTLLRPQRNEEQRIPRAKRRSNSWEASRDNTLSQLFLIPVDDPNGFSPTNVNRGNISMPNPGQQRARSKSREYTGRTTNLNENQAAIHQPNSILRNTFSAASAQKRPSVSPAESETGVNNENESSRGIQRCASKVSIGNESNVSGMTNGREMRSRRPSVTRSVQLSDSESIASSATAQNRKRFRTRCKYLNTCTNRACNFVHPTEKCPAFPECPNGGECSKLHEKCPNDGVCVNQRCTHEHEQDRQIYKKWCQNGSSCKTINCSFLHPEDCTPPCPTPGNCWKYHPPQAQRHPNHRPVQRGRSKSRTRFDTDTNENEHSRGMRRSESRVSIGNESNASGMTNRRETRPRRPSVARSGCNLNRSDDEESIVSSATTNNGYRTRCKWLSKCTSRNCKFVHPTETCPYFPECPHGGECPNLHEECPNDGVCVNQRCTYEHENRRQMRRKWCKKGSSCKTINCSFLHPEECTLPCPTPDNCWKYHPPTAPIPPQPIQWGPPFGAPPGMFPFPPMPGPPFPGPPMFQNPPYGAFNNMYTQGMGPPHMNWPGPIGPPQSRPPLPHQPHPNRGRKQ